MAQSKAAPVDWSLDATAMGSHQYSRSQLRDANQRAASVPAESVINIIYILEEKEEETFLLALQNANAIKIEVYFIVLSNLGRTRLLKGRRKHIRAPWLQIEIHLMISFAQFARKLIGF